MQTLGTFWALYPAHLPVMARTWTTHSDSGQFHTFGHT